MTVVAPVASGSVIENPANLQQWSNLIDSLFGTERNTNTSGTSTTSQSNSSAADGPLQVLIAQLMGTMGQGVNSAQIQALLGPIFMNLRDNALPGVQGLANAGGGVYNSSTQRLMQNDALARATAQGGSLVVQQQNQQQTQLATLLGILARSTAQQQTNQANNSNTRNTTAGNAGNAARTAAGLAAAANKLKALLEGRQSQGVGDLSGGDFEGDRNSSSDFQGGQGRSDSSDDTSGQEQYNPDSDPATFWGTEDAGANGYSDPNMPFDGGNDTSWLDGIFDPEGDWGDFGGSFDFDNTDNPVDPGDLFGDSEGDF